MGVNMNDGQKLIFLATSISFKLAESIDPDDMVILITFLQLLIQQLAVFTTTQIWGNKKLTKKQRARRELEVVGLEDL